MFLYDKSGQYEVAGIFTCSLAMQAIVLELRRIDGFEHSDGDMGLSTLNVQDFIKSRIGTDYGSKCKVKSSFSEPEILKILNFIQIQIYFCIVLVTIMCTSKEKVKEILLAAEGLDKMVYSGEYLFINLDLANR